ncbi:Stk1 family PASTA domain-containing Ser/Thr kinase [Alkalibacterium iburiense]|uniref:non-specific serine/threonine protein kinase n=1 Tax=Alkalibacterium iburiense TaxID=290589 RepID=A0ABN0X1L3_9LACT
MIPGERISNRYKIIREIGSGGMANVFLAEDLILERQVAVKLMAYNFHNDEASIRRFKREALSTTELTHPNIVNVVDVGEEKNPYIVMEYVEGYDLKEYIKEHYPIPYKKTISIMSQILDAVEYAHRHNIIHRDLKPQNILIDNHDTVKITDFGIAVALSENSITQTNSLLGSVHYISPEQARGSMATKQSDIYSLGILLYELLSGKVPFDGESAVSIALKHFQNDIPSLKETDSSMPQALENVVLKATAKEAHVRYASVREMKEDLMTAMSPSREDEPKFIPESNADDSTRVLTPITSPTEKNSEKPAKDLTDTKKTTIVEPVQKDSEGTQKKKNRKGLLLTIIITLLIVIGYFIFTMTQPQEVSVPPLEGLPQEEAVDLIEELNLVVGEIIELNDEEVDSGHVIRSNPSERAIIREGAEVDLYVSIGQEPIAMPDVEGENYQEARAELTSMNFTVESEEENHDTIPEGVIISQSITPGEDVIPNETTVNLIVSSGPQAYEFRDLTNFTETGVMEYIEELNLSVNFSYASHDTITEGRVVSQSPEPGSIIHSGQRISVVLSTGPEEPELFTFDRSFMVEYVAPEVEEDNEEETDNEEEPDAEETEDSEDTEDVPRVPNVIQVYVEDSENSIDDIYREFEIINDTEVTLIFNVLEGESATVRIDRDGETIIEESNIEPNN